MSKTEEKSKGGESYKHTHAFAHLRLTAIVRWMDGGGAGSGGWVV